jgi:glycosyltransferase involved in cell wall biosynthesis
MKRSIKVAMVAACPFPYSRGTPIRIFRLAESLSKFGHDVHVVTYHLGNEHDGSGFRIHRIPGIRTYKKYSPGPTYQKLLLLDLLLAAKLLNVLRSQNIDLIHAHHYEGLLASIVVRRFAKVPIIYDAHTLIESELPFYSLGLPKTFKKRIGIFLDKHVPMKADHIIAVTDDIKNRLLSYASVHEDKISVVSNGVEYEHFDVNPYQSKQFMKNRRMLIYTGNLADYQRIELLLKSFREVLNVRNDVCLLILTDSSFEPYEALADCLKVRKYVDIKPSKFELLPTYLAEADIALSPRTDCNGIPQKLLNYMAAGKPIVSYSGSAKIIEHLKTGWVAENENVIDFARGILTLLQDRELARLLGYNAKNYILSYCSWDKKADETEMVYRHVLSRVDNFV